MPGCSTQAETLEATDLCLEDRGSAPLSTQFIGVQQVTVEL